VAGELVRRLTEGHKTVACAESCTAGLCASLIARIPGASRALWGAFVTYTEEAKVKMLGVDSGLLSACGAVSRETALSMARGALEKSGAGLAFAVTGLAGPEGDGSGLPVGTVWIAWAARGLEPRAALFHLGGTRNEIRMEAALEAFSGLLKLL